MGRRPVSLKWLPILVVGALLPNRALAADNGNDLHFVQDGNANQGSVVQTGQDNKAGTAALPVHQTGVFDDLSLTQSGDDNNIGLANRGLVQDGSPSTDGSAANSATILQQSNGNSIGELVQTTLGLHPSTGNVLTVNQLTGGSNTARSIEQVQGSGDAANVATFTQNGVANWLEKLSQQSTSAGSNNLITLTFTGNYNGIDPGNQTGPGPLAILARSVGAAASQIVQGGDLSGGAANLISLAITGDFNQYGLTQLGADNSVAESITGLRNSFASYQLGQHNQVVSGGIAGDDNDVGLRQRGDANTASAVLNWSSSFNEVGIGQDGSSNTADISLKGDHGVAGISQNGNSHVARIETIGDKNVVLGIQVNSGLTAALGDDMSVSIKGSDNNGLVHNSSQLFTGPAFVAAQVPLGLSRSLLIAPDATLLLASLTPSITLVPGLLVQWGDGNQMAITVGTTSPSDANLFAALQQGNGNVITATVNGSSNQFVVTQRSDENLVGLEQAGTGNNAAVAQ